MICPKCKKEQPDSHTCIFCQIVVEKYLKRHPIPDGQLKNNAFVAEIDEPLKSGIASEPKIDESLKNDATSAPKTGESLKSDAASTLKTENAADLYNRLKQLSQDSEAGADVQINISIHRNIVILVTILILSAFALFMHHESSERKRSTTELEQMRVLAAQNRSKNNAELLAQMQAMQQEVQKNRITRADPFTRMHVSDQNTENIQINRSGGKQLSGAQISATAPIQAREPSSFGNTEKQAPPADPNITNVKLTVVTGHEGGTADEPIFEVFDNSHGEFDGETIGSLILDKSNSLQSNKTDVFEFRVYRSFCEITGWRIKKPAKSNVDSPWLLKAIYIELNGELVYFDNVLNRTITAGCKNYCAAGNWTRTESYKEHCRKPK